MSPNNVICEVFSSSFDSVDTDMHLANVIDTVNQLLGMVYLDVEENATTIEYFFN